MPKQKGSQHAPLRDVLAGLYNLEALLRSPRAAARIILGVLPELAKGTRTLADAFTQSAREPALVDLAGYAIVRVNAVCGAIERVPTTIEPRDRLALLAAVMGARPELEAAVDLLTLYEQAQSPEPTELSLAEVARVAFSAPPIAKGASTPSSLFVRVQGAEGSIVHDAHILIWILRHLAMRPAAPRVLLTVARESALKVVLTFDRDLDRGEAFGRMLLLRRIEPTDSVIDTVLLRAGGDLDRASAATRVVIRAMA